MNLKELRVFRLFDHFDHVVQINTEEKITILTAPNGYGKTVLLKIIDAIFNANYRFLLSLDFSYIEARLDSAILKISRHGEKKASVLEFCIAGDSDKRVAVGQPKEAGLWRCQ